MAQIDNTKGRSSNIFDLSVFEGVTTINNKACLIGRLRGKFEHNYTSSVNNEKYYKANIAVARKSGQEDNVRIMVPERLIKDNFETFERGVYIKVCGSLCSHLHTEAGKNRLRLYVFVETIELYLHQEVPEFNNCIYLKGRIHKAPYMRTARGSGKTITDLFITVIRKGNKWDFISCLTWGGGALMAGKLKIGDEIILKGRLQSRVYFERYNGDPLIGFKRDVHEVSVFQIVDVNKKEE